MLHVTLRPLRVSVSWKSYAGTTAGAAFLGRETEGWMMRGRAGSARTTVMISRWSLTQLFSHSLLAADPPRSETMRHPAARQMPRAPPTHPRQTAPFSVTQFTPAAQHVGSRGRGEIPRSDASRSFLFLRALPPPLRTKATNQKREICACAIRNFTHLKFMRHRLHLQCLKPLNRVC